MMKQFYLKEQFLLLEEKLMRPEIRKSLKE